MDLITVNIAVYTSIAVGLIQGWRRRVSMQPSGIEMAFRQVEYAVKERFPDMPEGFTMREALSRVRSLEPGLSWDQIEKSLEAYEEYRYGGALHPSGEHPELAELLRSLRRRW